MKIYESSVRKPISTILIFAGVIIFGLFSMKNLAVDMYPDMDIPAVMVMTTYSGVNAEEIETNITRVLEDNLNTVNHLKKLTSKSSDGVSLVTVQFEWGSNLDEATNEIRDAISVTSNYLPDGADDPIIFKFSSSMMPIMIFTVTADKSYAALNKLLDDQMVNRLNRIDGVGSVGIMGAPTREIQINVDPRKLEAYNLSVEQIGAIIAQENVNVSAGKIDIGQNTFNVKADCEFNSSDDLYSILISNQGGREVYLKDVAVIKDTLEKATLDERINGQLGVRVVVQKQTGANTVQIIKDVKKMMPEIEASLPDDINFNVVVDSSESIEDSVNSLSETVMFAFLFVILVVLFFLGRWRATLIICLTIPISLIVAFIYLYATGGTLNVISLSSLSIAIGMVVDDAIVVLENITTHIERGSTPKEAAIHGTNEVWLSVIATTLTVVAVFMPLTMVGGMAGIMFKQFGWIVSLVVSVSTLTALSLTPLLSSMMLRLEHQHHYKGLGKIFKPIDRFLDKLDVWYANMLNWSLTHKTLMIVIPLALLLFSLYIFGAKVKTEFTPATDDARLSVTVELEPTTGVEVTKQMARHIESIVKEKYPEIYLVSASTGYSSSNTSIFSAMSSSGSNYISFTMRLVPADERDRSVFLITDLLRDDLAQIPEIRKSSVSPGGMMGGMGGVSSVDIEIFGYDFDVTNAIAQELKAKAEQLEGARDVDISRDDMLPQYNVVFDRNKLAFYGLNSSTVAQAIRNRVNGMTASLYREDGDEYYVKVRYEEQFRTSIPDIENIIVYNSQGRAIRVGDVGTVVENFAPPAIDREDRQRVVKVSIKMADGVPLGQMVEEVNATLKDYTVPDGVTLNIGGTYEDQQDSFGDMKWLLLLIVLLVFIVMATQFESFVMPFIIMFTILFAFPGVFLALWITNTPLSLIALIGAMMLVGIVVKNGIVMVDYTNLMRERGLPLGEAVVVAGKSRLRPVLMTSLTTILGMLPMALGVGNGSEMWQPMGIAVIGGLLFSTVLTLLAIPAIYSVFIGAGLKRKERKAERKALKAAN